MKADLRSVVLVPSAAQAEGTTRGHRSLGDENLTLAKGKGHGSIQDRTNINARGWNNSTRASPIWKRNTKENKENGKPLVPKKFQHVQSKLSAPVFSQRRAKLNEGRDIGATGGPLQPSPDALNVPAQTPADNLRVCTTVCPQGQEALPAFDQFVTKRDCDNALDTLASEGHVLTGSGPSWPASPERHQAKGAGQLEAATANAEQRQSPHPSVLALYEYAENVRTPLHGGMKHDPGVTLMDHVVAPRDEASAFNPELQDGELTESFTSWLRCQGMQPHTLCAVALDKMGALWHKAKEATELAALVARLKENQAKVADRETQGSARAADDLVPDSEDADIPLQQHGEDHVAYLGRLSPTPADVTEAGHGIEAASAVNVLGQYAGAETGQAASSSVDTGFAAIAQIDSPGASTASVALWAQTPDKGSEHSSHSPAGAQLTAASAMAQDDEVAQVAAAGTDDSFSISLGSQIQPDFSSAFGHGPPDGVLQSTSSCASFAGAPVDGPTTPGFSIVSRVPEPVPFAAWANQVDVIGDAVSPAAPTAFGSPESAALGTPEGAMPSPGAVPSTTGAACSFPDAVSPQQSAGISFVSRAAQPVAFATWATCVGKPEPTPSSFKTTRHGPVTVDSPQLSAGLSVISSMPQAVAFDVWASVQRKREAQSAAAQAQSTPGGCGRESPLSSVGFETISKPERAGMWCNSGANTPADGAAAVHAHASPAGPHVRQNPLFEIDSPASTMSALPERADALGGLPASPSPARMLTAPSLASTPMSDFSQGLRSNLASPMGNEYDGSPASQFYGGLAPALHAAHVYGVDVLPSPAASPSSSGLVAVGVTTKSTEPRSPDAIGTPTSKTDSMHDHSPMHGEASVVATAPNGTDEDARSPPPKVASSVELPACSTPVADAEITATIGANLTENGVCILKGSFSPATQVNDISSPAIGSVTETGFAVNPVMDAVPTVHANECTNTSSAAQGDVVAAVDTAIEGPESSSPDRDSSTVDGTSYTPPPASTKAGDVDGGPDGDGPTQSYPDTPATAWPGSPTTVYATPLEAFPTPTSLASFCSAVHLTAMRIQAELASPDAATSNFTFGIQAGTCGGRQDAVTPALGPAYDNRFSASPVATIGFHHLPGANAVAAGFGSPMPLTQLTPVQLRALDHLAGHVMAALTPTRHEPASAQPDAAQKDSSTSSALHQGTAAAAVAFDLAQLLAHLRSPLPAHIGNQKSRLAPVATDQANVAPAACFPDPHSRQPGGASADAPSGAQAQHVDAGVVDAGVAEPSLQGTPSLPNFARLMAFLNAGGRAPSASPMETAISGAHSKLGDAARNLGSAPQGFSLAQLLSNLHSPLPDVVRMDSPAVGDKNSPASSEAASSAFGFSTAAKMSTRVTPAFTPGGCMSFMRWAHDTAPPSFRLDSDARQPRSRAAGTPSTPMSFSFGAFHGTAMAHEEATPVFGHGDSHGGIYAEVRSLPGTIFRSPDNDQRSGSGTQTAAESSDVHACGTVSPAAFSFGPQQERLSGHTPVPIGQPVVTSARDAPSAAKSWNQASPGISLGVWGILPTGGAASVRGSVTPSTRAFTFNHGGVSLMPTPMWPGLCGAASPVQEDTGAAPGQLSTASSPLQCGTSAQDSVNETPAGKRPGDGTFNTVTDVYAPAAAALWTVLLGNLHSPMPAAVRMPREQPKPTSSVSAASSLPPVLEAHPAGVSQPSLSGASRESESVAKVQTNAEVGAGARDLPPSYEELPDLITRGLCLPAPSLATGSPSLLDSAVGDLTNVSASSTAQVPRVDRPQASTGNLTINEAQPVQAWPPNEDGSSRHAEPVLQPLALLETEGSPVAAQRSSLEQLIVESVSSSNAGSESTLYAAGEAAGRTAEPAQVQFCEEAPGDRENPANGEEASVHSSPVFSFHVASEGSVESVSSSVVITSTTACAGGPSFDPLVNGSSATASHQRESVSGAQADSPSRTDSVAFSLDAVPRLLFSAMEGGATEPQAPSGATEIAEPPGSTVAPLYPTNGAPHAADVMRTPGTSPAPPNGRDAPDGAVSPVTFSYLSSGTPPSTPPTAELASTAKGGPSWNPRVSPRGSAGGAQFWAPSPAGPSAASGERVMLESSNRRIRTNPDILLDFQGSPGHIPPPMQPSGSVAYGVKGCGQLANRSGASYGAPQISPVRKGWEPLLAGREQQLSILPTSTTNSAEAHDSAKPKSDAATGTAPAAGHVAISRQPLETALGSGRLRALQQGVGPTLQQQVAMGIEHTIASQIHVPLSQRFGLWSQPAWGIPCGVPASGATSGALTASAACVQQQQACNVTSSTIPEVVKPVLTSRDVQTTPGLMKTVVEEQDGGQAQQDSVPLDSQVPERSAVVSRRPPFKSRIPAPGGISASVPVAAPVSAQPSGSVSAANSDDDESDSMNTAAVPSFGVVRRRQMCIPTGAVGGPQRMVIKRSTVQPRSVAQEAGEVVVLGDAEMRRRAAVMGMRISPYLRTKQGKKTATEGPKRG